LQRGMHSWLQRQGPIFRSAPIRQIASFKRLAFLPYPDPKALRLLYNDLVKLPQRENRLRRLLKRWRSRTYVSRIIFKARIAVLEQRWRREASAALGAWVLVYSRSNLLTRAARRPWAPLRGA
jgi:hypothetical protein